MSRSGTSRLAGAVALLLMLATVLSGCTSKTIADCGPEQEAGLKKAATWIEGAITGAKDVHVDTSSCSSGAPATVKFYLTDPSIVGVELGKKGCAVAPPLGTDCYVCRLKENAYTYDICVKDTRTLSTLTLRVK